MPPKDFKCVINSKLARELRQKSNSPKNKAVNSHADVDVFNDLKAGNIVIGKFNRQKDVDSRKELFLGAAEEGLDDLLAELDEMEADALAGELEVMDL